MPRTNGTTTQRGYDAKHKAERKRLEPIVARGETPCARCGELIVPPEPWDLGHTDDRTVWTGPEHQDCNRAAGARKRNARARRSHPPARPRIRPERDW
jgi:hypothetical protein